jgi:hypothetical protein
MILKSFSSTKAKPLTVIAEQNRHIFRAMDRRPKRSRIVEWAVNI